MSRGVCAYCRETAVLTKEHLWPASLHDRLLAVNQQSESSFWLSRLQREIPSEPQIRDVCANCNNKVLAELDGYICRSFDTYFAKSLRRDEKILFKYDYHRLQRWLLKLCYNSARIHSSVDREAIEQLLPYILSGADHLGRSTQLFVQLTYPQEVDRCEPEYENELPILFEPTNNRVGHSFFEMHGIGKKLLRVVHLRSFSFYIAFWPKGVRRCEQVLFENHFKRVNGMRLLRPTQLAARLTCDGLGAWESFKGSRGQFVFG
jgi:hypothetical protein